MFKFYTKICSINNLKKMQKKWSMVLLQDIYLNHKTRQWNSFLFFTPSLKNKAHMHSSLFNEIAPFLRANDKY